MDQETPFILTHIRKGKRVHYPDYFITIEKTDSFSATLSRERNKSLTIHYHDGGSLSFDNQMVDSFDNLKWKDLIKLNLQGALIDVQEFSGEAPEDFLKQAKKGFINFKKLLQCVLEVNLENGETHISFDWFLDLLNSEKEQNFLREHMATVRYFHGDFQPLKEFLIEDLSVDDDVTSDDEEPFFDDFDLFDQED